MSCWFCDRSTISQVIALAMKMDDVQLVELFERVRSLISNRSAANSGAARMLQNALTPHTKETP